MNNYNFMSVANNGSAAVACQAGQQNTTACFDPTSEYWYGILDVPHRFIVAPIFQLPFGKDHKIGKSAVGNAIGRRMDDRGGVQLPERVPDRRLAEQLGHQPAAATRCGRTSRAGASA